MTKSQLDGYERGYFHKIWVECYCLGENHASGTLDLNLLVVKIHTSRKMSKLCRHFKGTKTHMGKNFGI